MDNSPLLGELCDLAADIFAVDAGSLGPESSPDSVEGWDSMQHLNLVLALEQEYGVSFEPEHIEEMSNLASIVSMLEAMGVKP